MIDRTRPPWNMAPADCRDIDAAEWWATRRQSELRGDDPLQPLDSLEDWVARMKASRAADLDRYIADSGGSSRNGVATPENAKAKPMQGVVAGWQANKGGSAKLPPLRRIDVRELLTTTPPPVPWIVEPLIARGHLTMLSGREGRGKSLLGLAVAGALVSGESIAGMVVDAPGRVLVVDAENHEGELHRRLHSIGVREEAADRLGVFDGSALDLLNPAHLEELVKVVREHEPDVLLIDSMRSTWSGKENESEAVGPHLDRIRSSIARALDVGVVILHHDGKGGTGYRGSTAIGASVDLGFGLEKVEDDPERDRRRLQPWKFRIGATPPEMWLRLYGEPTLGIMEVERAEPMVSEKDAVVPLSPMRDDLAARLLRLLTDGVERRRADVARALSRDPKDRTTGRVLDALVRDGKIWRDHSGFYRLGDDS